MNDAILIILPFITLSMNTNDVYLFLLFLHIYDKIMSVQIRLTLKLFKAVASVPASLNTENRIIVLSWLPMYHEDNYFSTNDSKLTSDPLFLNFFDFFGSRFT